MKKRHPNHDCMTGTEVAEKHCIHPTSMRNFRAKDRGPRYHHHDGFGRQAFYDQEAVQDWLYGFEWSEKRQTLYMRHHDGFVEDIDVPDWRKEREVKRSGVQE